MRAAVVLVALAAIAGHAVADVVSPATPCENVLPAELEVTLRAEPLDPAVGDLVDLDVEITNTTGGLAGIPLFRLAGAEPLFAIESQENSYPYVEGARYRLRAAQPGLATLSLSVNLHFRHSPRAPQLGQYCATSGSDPRRVGCAPPSPPSITATSPPFLAAIHRPRQDEDRPTAAQPSRCRSTQAVRCGHVVAM
jgi:hypothetical protein